MGAYVDDIVAFIGDHTNRSIPAKASQVVADGFTDTVGVMVAGMDEPVHDIVLAYADSAGGTPTSRLALHSKRSTAAIASLVGTTVAHAIDFDDYAFSNHVSAVAVPPIVAEAEFLGSSGSAMVEAYAVGYEVWRSFMKREPDYLYARGWHPTGLFGVFGVVAALSVLHELNHQQIRNALGLAAANGAGIMANFGTMAKPYQGGRAAQAGVECVRLALEGMDAGATAIDSPSGGFLFAVSPEGNVDLTSGEPELGSTWSIVEEGLNIKRYPMVGSSQRAVDCAVQLRRDHAVDPHDIVRVVPAVSERHMAVMTFPSPETPLEAKFSLQFGVAVGLLEGPITLDHLTDTVVHRPDVVELAAKVEPDVGPDHNPSVADGLLEDTIAIHLKDGSIIKSEPVRYFRGHGRNPMNQDELQTKFISCTRNRLSESEARELFATLQRLPELGGAADIPSID